MKGLSELHILEQPQGDARYWMGTDPIPFGDKGEATLDSEDRSKQATVIIKENKKDFSAPYPVAFYLARTNDISLVYRETLFLQEKYSCRNNVERNAGGAFIQQYDNDGLGRSKLSPYPWTALVPDWKTKKIPREKKKLRGWNNDTSTKGPAIALLSEWIKSAASYTWSEAILEDIEKLGLENTDISWALISAIIDWKHTMNIEGNTTDDKKVVYVDTWQFVNGRMQLVREKMHIQERKHEGIDFGVRGGHFGFNR